MIIYLTPSLKKSGPTSQLAYQVKHLAKNSYAIIIWSLKQSKNDSNKLLEVINSTNITHIQGLSISSFYNIYIATKKSKSLTLISQGILGDLFAAIISRILAIITLAKVKWIMSIRAFWPEDYVSLFNSSLKGKFISKLHLLLAHFPDKRIFCSQSLLNKYLFYELLESSYNNQVIRNIAIEPDVIKRPEALIPTIVCLGSLIPRKMLSK